MHEANVVLLLDNYTNYWAKISRQESVNFYDPMLIYDAVVIGRYERDDCIVYLYRG